MYGCEEAHECEGVRARMRGSPRAFGSEKVHALGAFTRVNVIQYGILKQVIHELYLTTGVSQCIVSNTITKIKLWKLLHSCKGL